jgi:predicted acyltransferase
VRDGGPGAPAEGSTPPRADDDAATDPPPWEVGSAGAPTDGDSAGNLIPVRRRGWTGADLVFPGFLFVVGVSLAFSLRRGWSFGTVRVQVKRFLIAWWVVAAIMHALRWYVTV